MCVFFVDINPVDVHFMQRMIDMRLCMMNHIL